MSVIKINAITVPVDTGDGLAIRFRERQARGAMQDIPGFEGFELFQPSDDREQWLVVTRWESDEAFHAWQSSDEFRKAHERTPDQDGTTKKPVGTHAELWSYSVAVAG